MAREFRRGPAGIELRFEGSEAELVEQLVDDLVQRLADVDDAAMVTDPVLSRLFPDGYHDDPAAAAELRSLIQDDLRDGKIASAKAVLETLHELPESGRLTLDADQAGCWLGTLNDVRLTLGTALGVTEETELALESGDEQGNFALGVYFFLGWLQGNLVESMAP
ncbi:MAG: DUF2017 domain-containing protein [Mycobacteriales bacterium]